MNNNNSKVIDWTLTPTEKLVCLDHLIDWENLETKAKNGDRESQTKIINIRKWLNDNGFQKDEKIEEIAKEFTNN